MIVNKSQTVGIVAKLRNREWHRLNDLLAGQPSFDNARTIIDVLHWSGIIRSRLTPGGELEYQWINA